MQDIAAARRLSLRNPCTVCLPGEAMVGDETQDATETAPGAAGRDSSDEAGAALAERSGAGQSNTPTGPSLANKNPAEGKRWRKRC